MLRLGSQDFTIAFRKESVRQRSEVTQCNNYDKSLNLV